MAAISSTKPMMDTSPMRPGRMKRRYTPMNSATGIVAATVNVPHGESASAFTTMSASTARMMIMIMNAPNSAISPGTVPISCLTRSPSERPSRRVEMNSTIKSCTAPANTTPARIHSRPGR